MAKLSSKPKKTKTVNADVFKIRKAKVGKRAPQKLNTTDTSFKTSQLRLRDQKSSITSTTNSNNNNNNAESLLSSQQGKTIATLMTQLTHPSPVVRKSGLRGIKNIIDRMDSNNSSTTTTTSDDSHHQSIISQQLSLILPPLGQSLLDEDDGVRSLGSLCLRTLLRRCGRRSRGGGSSSSSTTIAPFLELLMAYLSSCLNSLDEDVRYDGVDVLHDLFLECGRDDDNGDVVERLGNKLIPCFISLLSSSGRGGGRRTPATTTTTTGNTSKKRKRREGKKNGKGDDAANAPPLTSSTTTLSRRCRVLRALVVLLRATAAAVDDVNETNNGDDEDDGVITQPDFIWGEEDSSLPYGLLPLLDDNSNDIRRRHHRRHNNSSTHSNSHNPNNKTQLLTLLSKLRDSWLELSQRGTKHGIGLALSPHLLFEAHLIIHSVLYLRSSMISSHHANNNNEKLSKMERSVVMTFLETFPLRDESSSSMMMMGEEGGMTYASVNAAYCALLSRYYGTTTIGGNDDGNYNRRGGSEEVTTTTTSSNNNEKSFWVDKVLNYAIPQLKHLIDDDGPKSNNNTTTSVVLCPSSAAAVTLVSVLQPLLCSSTLLLTNETARLRLLDTFRLVFFSSEEEEDDDDDVGDDDQEEAAAARRRMRRIMVRRSPVGHGAVLVLSRLIKGHYNIGMMTVGSNSVGGSARLTDNDEWNRCLSRMILSIPSFLEDLSNVSSSSSYALLESLLCVAKRWNPLGSSSCSLTTTTTVAKDDDDNTKRHCYKLDHLVQRLRHDISLIFSTPRNNKNNNKNNPSRKKRREQTTLSIFERYPPSVQRLSLSLIGMLSQPSPLLLSSLAAIAKRASLAAAAAAADSTMTMVSDEGRKEETEALSPPRKKRRTIIPTTNNNNNNNNTAMTTMSSSIIDYLFSIIHNMRKTTKMTHYLTFLVDTVGFPSSTTTTSSSSLSSIAIMKQRRQRVMAYDEGIFRMRRFVMNSIVDSPSGGGGGRIMNMLTPVLISWIETVEKHQRQCCCCCSFVELRAALVVLSSSCRDEEEGMVVSNIMLKTRFVEAIITFWMSLTWNNGATTTTANDGTDRGEEGEMMEERVETIQMLEPIARLMTRHSPLCQKLLRTIIPTIQQQQQEQQSDNNNNNDGDNKQDDQETTNSKQSSSSLSTTTTTTTTTTSAPVDTTTANTADERQTTENIITAMTILFKSFPPLKDALRQNDESSRLLLELVSSMETMVKDGSLDRLGGLLKMDVFLFLGCSSKMGE